MVKENPCNKCCSYNPNKVCECNELSNYRHYQQGRADKYGEIVSEYMLLTEEQVEEIRADEREKVIELYTEFCRKNHSDFHEDYAEDIKSDFEEWLKGHKNE